MLFELGYFGLDIIWSYFFRLELWSFFNRSSDLFLCLYFFGLFPFEIVEDAELTLLISREGKACVLES